MAQKIGPQHGVEATRQRLQDLWTQATDGKTLAAFDKLLGKPGEKYASAPTQPVEGTLVKLIEAANEHEDRLAALEAQQPHPFPH